MIPENYDIEEESHIMPSKREYKVKLHIRKIEKLKPSICDEIEIDS